MGEIKNDNEDAEGKKDDIPHVEVWF